MLTTIDPTKLLEYNDATARVLKHFMSRQRYRGSSDLKRVSIELRAEAKENGWAFLEYKQIIQVMLRLQELGFGTLVKGRYRQADRFEWNYNYIEAASALLGKYKEAKKLQPLTEAQLDGFKQPLTIVPPRKLTLPAPPAEGEAKKQAPPPPKPARNEPAVPVSRSTRLKQLMEQATALNQQQRQRQQVEPEPTAMPKVWSRPEASPKGPVWGKAKIRLGGTPGAQVLQISMAIPPTLTAAEIGQVVEQIEATISNRPASNYKGSVG